MTKKQQGISLASLCACDKKTEKKATTEGEPTLHTKHNDKNQPDNHTTAISPPKTSYRPVTLPGLETGVSSAHPHTSFFSFARCLHPLYTKSERIAQTPVLAHPLSYAPLSFPLSLKRTITPFSFPQYFYLCSFLCLCYH